eukprot:m.31634 g.31634  ORF g.31634 m.31634 type:complete len:68 (+) comp9438_c0_seq1:140-343(+)
MSARIAFDCNVNATLSNDIKLCLVVFVFVFVDAGGDKQSVRNQFSVSGSMPSGLLHRGPKPQTESHP